MTSQNNLESLVQLIRQRTENFYAVHRLCCSEAIMYVLNKGLKGGLDDKTVLQISNGFCGGMGGGEGTCGALTGAIATIGLFLSPQNKNGLSKRKARLATKDLHDRFKEQLKSINCADLTRNLKHQRKARIKNCQKITGIGAEITAAIILKNRPELIAQANLDFLSKNDTKMQALTDRLRSFF